jgi:phage terminase large subunit-like protein
LLEELYRRGLQQPLIGDSLHAGDGLLMAWHHKPVAPWQDEAWLKDIRRQRASVYQRHVLNELASSSSQFVDMNKWDVCVRPALSPVYAEPETEAFVGIDASVKHDSCAIVAVTFDRPSQMVRLLTHRVFQPTPDQPLDFENTIEATVLDLKRRFALRAVRFDPYQMVATARRLSAAGVRMEEFPQSVPNLTAASQNLFHLIASQAIALYPDADMRLSVSRAVAVESPRLADRQGQAKF